MKQNYRKIRRVILLCALALCGAVTSAQTISPVEINGKWGYQYVETKQVIISNLDQALPFNNGIALAQADGKWGGYNLDFQTIIPFVYDQLDHISSTYITARKGIDLFLFNGAGNKIIDQAFSDVAILNGTTDTFVVADQKGKYGLLSSNGSYLIPPTYNSPPQETQFANLLIFHRMIQNSYYAGVVDLNGFIIVPFEFLFIKAYGNNSLRGSRLNGNTSYYALDGQLIYDDQSKAQLVIDESFVLIIKEKEQILYNRKTGDSYPKERWQPFGKWYYSRNENDKKTTVITDDGTSFTINGQVLLNNPHDGYVQVSKKTEKGYRYGLIDDQGNEVLKLDLLDLREWNNRWAVIKEKDETRYSLYDLHQRRRALPAEFTNIQLYSCGYVETFDHKESSYLTPDLELFDPSETSNTLNLPVYYAWTERQRTDLERKFRYNTPGKSMTDYSHINHDDCANRYYDFSKVQRISLIMDRYGKNPIENRLTYSVVIEGRRKVGLLDFNGKVVVPAIYEGFANHENGLFPFFATHDLEYRSKRLSGLMDANGNIILDPIYDNIERSVDGVAIVKMRGLYHLVDIESKKVLLTNYQGIGYNEHGYFTLRKHGLQGLADRHGNILIRPIYKELSYRPTETGMYTAERDDKKFYVDLKGNEFPRSE